MLTMLGMTKHDAISIFGGVPELASALGITRQAIYQWPDSLSQRTSDQVMGAAARLGKPSGKTKTAPSGVRALSKEASV